MRTRPPGGGLFAALATCVLSLAVAGEALSGQAVVTAEAQAYPAGVIVRLGAGTSYSGWSFTVLGGYNATDRRDWGEHEDEEGGGPGLGVRVARGPQHGGTGPYGEARLDLWFMDVDWIDNGGTRQGTSELRVVQPTAGIGYQWRFGVGRLRLGAALGWELNTALLGEPVGEGPILLVGFQIDFGRGLGTP